MVPTSADLAVIVGPLDDAASLQSKKHLLASVRHWGATGLNQCVPRCRRVVRERRGDARRGRLLDRRHKICMRARNENQMSCTF